MKNSLLCLILICTVACGRSDEPQDVAADDPQRAADQAVSEAQETVDRALSGKPPESDVDGAEGCVVFDTGLIPDVFGVEPSMVSYRRSIPVKSAGHVVCLASWDKPNKAELDKAYTEAITAWTMERMKGVKNPQPKPSSGTSSVSLTLVANTFNSDEEAIASLESAVATLSKGVSVEVGGKTHETKMSFGDWMDSPGDKAVFSDKGELLVAANGRRISVNVSAMADEEQDREKAIELAQRVIDTF
jgi:hypothetical protein